MPPQAPLKGTYSLLGLVRNIPRGSAKRKRETHWRVFAWERVFPYLFAWQEEHSIIRRQVWEKGDRQSDANQESGRDRTSILCLGFILARREGGDSEGGHEKFLSLEKTSNFCLKEANMKQLNHLRKY